VDEAEESNGKPSGESLGGGAATGGGEGDEEEAGGDETEGGDEERASFWKHLLHGHHSRTPEEERGDQHRQFPRFFERNRLILLGQGFGSGLGLGLGLVVRGRDEALDVEPCSDAIEGLGLGFLLEVGVRTGSGAVENWDWVAVVSPP
ncbi:hypothetical protein TorRG33x02_005590, partial [Trema orientale]